jgi:signal transduction histidine kinase
MIKHKSNSLISARHCFLFIWFICPGIFTSFAGDLTTKQPSQTLTNINQFDEAFNENADVSYPYHLLGMVTMVDTNRDLFVLQDDTGAVALNMNGKQLSILPGQLIAMQGTRAAPYFEPFPNYPYQPSGWDVRKSFEAPSNWGEYHLTRMRGYLHPPVTGDYIFWLASDNSSELWLSSDDNPAKARKIAFIKSGDWVNQYEWLRYPSQRSEAISLSADKTYYIEAVSEQLLLDENLAVAWQPPGFKQSVIEGRYLTPWLEYQDQMPSPATNGVLREYWTNYTLGSVNGIIGKRLMASMFVLKEARIAVVGPGTWPKARTIILDKPLLPEDNYHWVKVQGKINFGGVNGRSAVLDLAYNGSQAQVRVADWGEILTRRFQDRLVQVEGVCEGMITENGYMMPGVIWTPTQDGISFIASTNADDSLFSINSLDDFAEKSSDTNHIWSGFVSIRGVVTFNDQVFGRDFLFIQNDSAGIFISQMNHHFHQLQVGQWVEVGGTLMPGGSTPSLNPVVVTILGSRPIPKPMTHPVETPVLASRNGQWTELEGVIHAINPNGTMLLKGRRGTVSVWLGHTTRNLIDHYVDSTLRLRGVLSLATPNDPVLLVPSRDFVEVKEPAPQDPFWGVFCDTTDINDAAVNAGWIHRVKIKGVVTCNKGRSVFVQDARGGLRVELLAGSPMTKVGDAVEVSGFPEDDILSKTLTEGLLRATSSNMAVDPHKLNLTKTNLPDYYNTLVSLEAKIIAQKFRGAEQVLDLQEGQRFCEAVLSTDFGRLPVFEPGSRLKITGVLQRDDSSAGRKSTDENELSAPVNILLRGPLDVVVVRGAPWWTWKGFVLLASILLTVITAGLSVIVILRRRLERQRQAKFNFSRQILQSQEEERRRIAVNLHDALGQNLLFIKNQSHLAIQMPADESGIRNRLHDISKVTAQAIEEVRQITRNLRPYQLDRLGLTQAVQAVIKQVSENSPTVFASHVDEIDGIFDKESEIHIYRIIQESLNNIIKHSGATEATVVIKKQAGMVSLSIRDNGQGFDATQEKSIGLGLNSIAERAWILGGKSKIDASPGGGTSLTFEIPTPDFRNET